MSYIAGEIRAVRDAHVEGIATAKAVGVFAMFGAGILGVAASYATLEHAPAVSFVLVAAMLATAGRLVPRETSGLVNLAAIVSLVASPISLTMAIQPGDSRLWFEVADTCCAAVMSLFGSMIGAAAVGLWVDAYRRSRPVVDRTLSGIGRIPLLTFRAVRTRMLPPGHLRLDEGTPALIETSPSSRT